MCQSAAPSPADIILHLISATRPSPHRAQPAASCRLHLFWALEALQVLGLLKSARFHQFPRDLSSLWAPRKLQVSPTVAPSQAAGFTSFGPIGSAPGFTYFGPPHERKVSPTSGFSQLPSFTKLQAPPTLGTSQAAGFTSFGPLGSAPGFSYFGTPQECPTSGQFQVSPTLRPLQAPSFTYFRPLASCRLHLFWAPWKRSTFQRTLSLLKIARFHLLWAPRKLQVSPTVGPSQAAGFTSFGPLGNAPGFTYFEPPQDCQVSPTSGPLLWAPRKLQVSPILSPSQAAGSSLLWAPRKLQVSPTVAPSQAAGFTSFGPLETVQVSRTLSLLKSDRFHQLRAPRECQVSPTLSPLLGPLEALQVSPTLGLLKSARFYQLREAASFTYFRPLASCRLQFLLGSLEALQVSPTLGLLKSARFHHLQAPRECQVSPTFTLASCRLQLFWAPWKRSRFQLLWDSSRVPGFTNFRPPASARFHLLWAPHKLQVSPTLGPSQAAGFTSFGPLGSAPGFTYFGLPQECQVSPISGPSQARSFTYFGPSNCRLHLFWAHWKRSRFHLLWASSRVPGFTNCEPLASARFGPLASSKFHLL